MSRRARAGLLAAAAVLAAGLAGCTGVPTSSGPEVVGTVGENAPTPVPLPTPPRGAPPRQIVIDFLEHNASNDAHHAAARQFLTQEEKTRWAANSGVTILDSVHVGTQFDATHHIVVTGHVIGSLDENGVYKPNLQRGDGTSPRWPIQLKQTPDGWRISNLTYSGGLLISEAQFRQYYRHPWVVYFYDQAERRLVPNLRYSSLTDPQALGSWLLGQLVAGPTASPGGTSLTTDLPSIPDATQLKLTMGRRTVIGLPGASQLDAPIKNRMAAQVALTLSQASAAPIQITDGGKPVVIPSVGSATFTAADFRSEIPSGSTDPALYFIYQGGISDEHGNQLSGGIGDGQYQLSSAALARIPGSQRLRVAATSGSTGREQLLLGQTGGELRPTRVSGVLSRPEWAPGLNEVWIADAAALVRVGKNGKAAKIPVTPATGTLPSGRIVAVRLSPEGARVALVISTADGKTSQIWIGTVSRTSKSVQVVGAVPISPAGVVVADVAWSDQSRLYAVGYARGSGDPSVYEVRCDGSFWLSDGIGNLPQGPDSVTVAQGVYPAAPAVSTGPVGNPTVWVLGADGTWQSPDPNSFPTHGTNPVYVN